MAGLLEYTCPSCGGALHFDSAAQKVKCPYCDTEFDMEAMKALEAEQTAPTGEELPWQSPDTVWQAGEEDSLVRYLCRSCGGEIVADRNTAATCCPFCGNPVIISDKLMGKLRPEVVIPFRLTKEAAQAAFYKHLAGKRLLPKVFRDASRIQKIQGVYVPFWLFDGEAQGDFRYRATRTHVWSDRDYTYTQTSFFSVRRTGTVSFAGVPVDGSSKMADDLMDALGPFDLSQGVDFQTAYLAGYLADQYDVPAEACTQRANRRVRESAESAFASTVTGYASVTPYGGSLRLERSRTRYALYPVWLLHVRYQETDYLFAVNGQTGKFVGDLPMDQAAYWKWWGAVAAATSAAGILLSLVTQLL